MASQHLPGHLLLLALGLELFTAPAHADMRVLGSNVASYPRDMRIKGDKIGPLGPGEWVHVLIVEENKTQFFGDPPLSRQGLGTRGPRKRID